MLDHYIWQLPHWTEQLRFDSIAILAPLSRARLRQGHILGQAAGLGFDLGREIQMAALTNEAVTTAAIEGEALNPASVRSSIARRLGLSTAGLAPVERRAEGLVEVLLDATSGYDTPLTAERLKGWQAALFPTGYSGMRKITVGEWRQTPEPMQVVSGPIGRERVHYEAPPSASVPDEMERFLGWWSASRGIEDGLIRAAKAHLWFVTIHPFEDGNGRIGRALADMALAQDEATSIRCYSLSAEIQTARETYYDTLQMTQTGDGDITAWLKWFMETLAQAVTRSEVELERILAKARFWQRHGMEALNARQIKALNRLLDAGPGGFGGGLTTKKYAHMTKTSGATAKREILELREKGILVQRAGTAGRSTSYELVW
jgi:Fic family protein